MSASTVDEHRARADRWPRVTAVLHSPTRATLLVNESARPCEAPTADRLRDGVVARAAALARTVGRPVLLQLVGGEGAREVEVGPDGDVHRVGRDGTVSAEAEPSTAGSPCRRCGASQALRSATCSGCGTLEPHRVELVAVPVLDAGALTSPDVALAEQVHAQASAAARPDLPLARLLVDDVEPVTFRGCAALGRNPAPAPGRTVVRVTSPGMLVSKTHLLVEVAADGTVRATDCGSTNGSVLVADPPRPLAPGVPQVLAPGSTVRLGDVSCRVELVGAAAR